MTRGTDIGARIEGLEAAAAAARGRLDDALVDEAEAVAQRAAARLRLSADHTVVAIAGATGSGKSSTFNALIGLELASVGVRRPTTSWATACVWGSQGADELLDWLGIPPRHQSRRDSMLDTQREDRSLDGVVLLDLPDHDSTEVVPPPRGRPAGAARRPAGVGARPAEVRRRRDPRPLPRAAAQPRRGDRGGAQPHRHRAGGPAPGDGRRRTPPARRRRAARTCRSSRSVPGTVSGSTGCAPRSPTGSRPRRRPAPALDADLKAAAERIAEANGSGKAARAVRPPGRRPRGRVRRRRGRAHRRLRGRAVDPDPRRTRHRVAGGVVALAAAARSPQAAPPRPGRSGQAAHPHRPYVPPGHHAGPACPGRHRGARARRPGVAGSRPALGRGRTPRVDVPARRPRRPARRGDGRHRSRRRQDPGVGRRRTPAAVAADPGRPRRRGMAGRAGGDGLPGAARPDDAEGGRHPGADADADRRGGARRAARPVLPAPGPGDRAPPRRLGRQAAARRRARRGHRARRRPDPRGAAGSCRRPAGPGAARSSSAPPTFRPQAPASTTLSTARRRSGGRCRRRSVGSSSSDRHPNRSIGRGETRCPTRRW